MNNQLSLQQICSLYNTDKNNYHSYVDEIYENLFKEIRNSTQTILEIGVDTGASLLMWKEYFSNAEVYGIDNKFCSTVLNRDRIKFICADAYDHSTLGKIPEKFDIIIDDGPHTLESMLFIIKEYLIKLNNNGILIIEDLQECNWTNILKRHIPNNYSVDVKDLRKVRGRYDDIAMIIRPINF